MQGIDQAEKIENTVSEAVTVIRVLCPTCGREVNKMELEAWVCSACKSSLEKPQQNVEVHVTSVPLFAETF